MEAAGAARPRRQARHPLAELLGKADIGWTLARGAITVAGRTEALTISTRSTERCALLTDRHQAASVGGAVGGALGGLLNGNLGQACKIWRQDARTSAPNCAAPSRSRRARSSAPIGASIPISAPRSPSVTARCRSPHQAQRRQRGQADARAHGERADGALAGRIRNDPALELAARREWARMCPLDLAQGRGARRTRPVARVKPMHAFAAQPRIDQNAVTLTLGLQAENAHHAE